MGRGIKGAGQIPQDALGAIAVMNVEIDHRHPFKPVGRPGVQRADGGVVEEAEAHRRVRLGMMTGRAHGTKGVAATPARHFVHRRHHRADRPQRRLARMARDEGVGIQLVNAVVTGHRRENALDMSLGVGQQQMLGASLRRGLAQKIKEVLMFKNVSNRPQPIRAFRMILSGVVLDAVRVREQQSWHRRRLFLKLCEHD